MFTGILGLETDQLTFQSPAVRFAFRSGKSMLIYRAFAAI